MPCILIPILQDLLLAEINELLKIEAESWGKILHIKNKLGIVISIQMKLVKRCLNNGLERRFDYREPILVLLLKNEFLLENSKF